MADPPNRAARVGFGIFELDRVGGVLYRNGYVVRLQAQPMAILVALVERPGEDITREELRSLLWPDGRFVEFDASIGTAIRKIRQALGDSLTNPIFVRTLNRRGFRFIAPVHAILGSSLSLEAAPPAPALTEPEIAPAVKIGSPAPRAYASWLMVAIVVAVLAGVALLLFNFGALGIYRAHPVHFSIDLPAGQVFEFYSGRRIAISADGQTLGYIAELNGIRQIFTGRMEDANFRPVPGTENALSLGFSPHADWLVFLQHGELRKVSADGRVMATVIALNSLSDASGVRFIWGSDDQIYFSADQYQSSTPPSVMNVYRVSPSGGAAVKVVSGLQTNAGWHYPQQLLPGGRDLLFSSDWAPQDQAVNAWSFHDQRVRQLVDHASGGLYVSSGYLVFTRSGNIMAAPFDLRTMRVTGKTAMVVPDVAFDRYAGSQMAVSDTGTLVYFKSTLVKQRQPVWVDLQGHETTLNLPPGRYRLLDLTRDGSKLLLTRFDAGERWTMFSFDMKSAAWTKIVASDSPNTGAVWSPDGRSVVLAANYRGEHYDNLYLKSVQDRDPARPLTASLEFGRYPQSWSGAANAIVYEQGYDLKTRRDIYVLSLAPGSKPLCLICTAADERYPEFSRDGKWVAYSSGTSGRSEIYAQSWPRPGKPVRISPDGGENSLWSHSARELYYRRGDEMWAVSFDPAQTEPGKARRLFSGKYSETKTSPWNRDMLLSADGNRFLMLKTLADPPDNRRVQVVMNWFEELQQIEAR